MDQKGQSETKEAALWLTIVSQLFTTRMNKLLSKEDLTLTQFSILNHIARMSRVEPQSISEIANAVEAQQPAVTKIISKFEDFGWVESVRAENDKRTKRIQLTKQGGSALMELQMAIGPDLTKMFQELNADECQALTNLLKKLGRYLDKHRL